MANKSRQRFQKPDEVFSSGPLTIARFGNNVVWKSDWPEGVFDEFQKNLIELYPEIVQEISTLVSDIANLVAVLPPEELLHRAWSEMAVGHMRIESEVEIEDTDALAMRMLDYVQSIIAAVPPQAQHQELTEEAWNTLKEKVGELFEKVNYTYQISRTAKNKAENPNFDESLEEFHFRAQLYWCNVRGKRYQVHEPAYLRQIFRPYSNMLLELFGISGAQFADEIIKIWRELSFGIGEAFNAMDEFRKDTLDAIKEKIAGKPDSAEQDLRSIMAEIIEENHWEERQDEVFSRLFGTDLFDVQKITTLPEELLLELTWAPGEETEFFSPGEFSGWPLRIWPVFKRPFIRLHDRYYCFDLYNLLDNIYRVMQRVVLRLKPEYLETWNLIQKELSENLPFEYFARLLPEAQILKPVYYRGQTASGSVDWCEADGLLIYDDYLFVVEAKGGAFTYTPPATDFPAWITSLKNLVLNPSSQGRRFVKYLTSAETIPLFDKDHNQVDTLCKSDFRHVIICPITLDPFTEIAAQVQHLRKIGMDVGSEPIWAMSIDDLQVYADIFETPLFFLHYVEQRMQAFQSNAVRLDDELDHLGLYLKHNHYCTHAEEMQGELDTRIQFFGYRSDLDEFFAKRMLDPDFPCPLRQEMPSHILEIVEFLSQSAKTGRAEIASYLLDLANDWREFVSSGIDEELTRQLTTKRAMPFSTHGSVNLTLFCWSTDGVQRDAALALEHARTVLLVNNDLRRLLLELTFTGENVLKDISWSWIDLSEIPKNILPKLRAAADRLRQTRVANAKAEKRKIGRNEQCPCGSGKKYKKCCLRRLVGE